MNNNPNNPNTTISTDKLHKARGIIKISKAVNKEKKINYSLQIGGFLLFTSIFIIGIPLLLYKTKYYTILEGYLPNVDLIATALSWHGGPFGGWKELYPASPITQYGFISQVFINYIALLGLTYIIAREASVAHDPIKGWSMGFVMLLMTYLLPSNTTIIPLMDYISEKLDTIKSIPQLYQTEIVTLIGLITSFIIIYLESLVLKYSRYYLYKIGHTIIQIPKLF